MLYPMAPSTVTSHYQMLTSNTVIHTSSSRYSLCQWCLFWSLPQVLQRNKQDPPKSTSKACTLVYIVTTSCYSKNLLKEQNFKHHFAVSTLHHYQRSQYSHLYHRSTNCWQQSCFLPCKQEKWGQAGTFKVWWNFSCRNSKFCQMWLLSQLLYVKNRFFFSSFH